jgi:hypothetical protein
MLGIPNTRQTSAKVGSLSHGSFLMPKVIVVVLIMFSFVNPGNSDVKQLQVSPPYLNILPRSSLERIFQARIAQGTALKTS